MLNLCKDSAVVQDPDGEGKIVYLFLPLYKVRWYDFLYFKLLHRRAAGKPARCHQRALNQWHPLP